MIKPAHKLSIALALTALTLAPAALAGDTTGASAPAPAAVAKQGSIIGTWFVTVPGPTEADTFYAYQTFNADGTFTETSSLLATLTEGPAHGNWRMGAGGLIYLTFELFGFDENHAPSARIRVRAELRQGGNQFTGNAAVDILALDGEVIAPNVGTGSLSATRVPILPL